MHPARYNYNMPMRGALPNLNHPLGRGLVTCLLMNDIDCVGQIADISGHQAHGVWNNTPVWTVQDKGPALEMDSANDGQYLIIAENDLASWSTAQGTVIIRFKLLTSVSTAFLYDAWFSDVYLSVYSGSGTWQVYIGENEEMSTGLAWDINTWYDFVLVYNNGAWASYQNGIAGNTGTYTGAPSFNSNFLVNNANGFGDNEGLDGVYQFLYVYNRALTAREVEILYEQPYIFFNR